MHNFEDVAVGDKVLIVTHRRFGGGKTYTGPVEVVKVTKTQFTAGGQRFTKSWGHPVGRPHAGVSAEPATPAALKERDEYEADRRKKENAKKAKADAEEMRRRVKYGAEHIDEVGVQKLLAEVRQIAEIGWGVMEEFRELTKDFNPMEPWHVVREITDWHRPEKLAWGMVYQDMATDLHKTLVSIHDNWIVGETFKINDRRRDEPELNDLPLVDIMKIAINHSRRRIEAEFFRFKYKDDNAEAWAKYIGQLRDIDDVEHDYPSIALVKEDE